MIPSEITLIFVLLESIFLNTDCLVISPRWEHIRWKTVPPSRTDIRRSGEITLSCSATGSPAPSLAWYKDGLFTPHLDLQEAEEEGSSLGETIAKLRIPCMSEKEVGQYECRARAGKQEISVVSDVKMADWTGEGLCMETGAPQIAVWSPTLMVEEGHSALLRCRAMKGDLGQVKVVWRDGEGKELGNGERHSISPNGDLLVRKISFLDMGTYTCNLSNNSGDDSISTFLYPLAPSSGVP